MARSQRLTNWLTLSEQECALYRSDPFGEERKAKSVEARKALVLHQSEYWANSCLNSLRFFRKFKQYSYTSKDEKVMKRTKK